MKKLAVSLPWLLLVLVLFGGAKFGTSSSETLQSASTPPTIPRWGSKTWLRTDDNAFFVYNETSGKLVNTTKTITMFGGNGAPFSAGGLGINNSGLVSDTTSATPNGIPVRKTITMKRAKFQCDAVSPACSLRVFKQTYGGAPTLMHQFVCNLNVQYFEGLTASADSGQIITCYLSTNTTRPQIQIEWEEEITPP